MEDYKSLCAAVTICVILVNINIHTESILTSLYECFSQLIFASFQNDADILTRNDSLHRVQQ